MAVKLRRAEQVERNRTAVLDAARRVFLDRGYGGATVDAIAEEAGFSKGVVYSQFGSKADMFMALLEQRITERAAQNERIAAGKSVPEAARELLLAANRDVVRSMAEFVLAMGTGLTLGRAANPAALPADGTVAMMLRALIGVTQSGGHPADQLIQPAPAGHAGRPDRKGDSMITATRGAPPPAGRGARARRAQPARRDGPHRRRAGPER